MNRTSMNTRGLLAAGLIAALAGGALAFAPGEKEESGTQQVNLGGPKVEQGGAPEEKRAEREGPRLVEFMAAARSLRRSGEELGITPEQREAIGAAVREHRAAMAEFIAEHREEIDELRAQAGLPERDQRAGLLGRRAGERDGQRGGARGRDGDRDRGAEPENEMGQPGDAEGSRDSSTVGGRGGRGAQPPTPEQIEAIDRLRELMATGPDESAVIEKIRGALSAEQNGAIDRAIVENRERRQKEGTRERRQRGPQGTDRERGQRSQTRRQKQEDDSDG